MADEERTAQRKPRLIAQAFQVAKRTRTRNDDNEPTTDRFHPLPGPAAEDGGAAVEIANDLLRARLLVAWKPRKSRRFNPLRGA